MNESSNFYQLTEKLIQDLSKLGVKDATLERRQSYFRSISTYMKQRDIAVYTPQVGAEYLAYKKSKLVFKSYQCEVANIHQLNEVYNNIPVTLYHTYRQRRTAPQEYAEIFLNYKKKLEADGLKQTTIECQMSEIALFCINLKNSGILDIHDVTPQLLIKVASMSDSQNYCPTVRRFLRYLAKNAILDRDLSAYLPKSKSCVILPSVYSKTELDAIESTFDCDTAIGKRNHAMFLLSSRLGFRTSDVRNLKFSDIDFEYNIISIIQVKTEVPLKISLVSSVKSALIDYIENGRPKSNSEYIFLKHMAPYTELSCDTMYGVISTAIYKAGISIKNRKRGPHVLRSSLATAMINNGMTYEHVRKILGHQEENAINHYASLEIERLRLCALEVSEPTGYFASFLEGKEAIHDA